MGKKGTKRKTKWRALPLGEDYRQERSPEFLEVSKATLESPSHEDNVPKSAKADLEPFLLLNFKDLLRICSKQRREAGGSGNEEDFHDEDRSTASSVVGGHPINGSFKRQSFYYKMVEKPYKQARRFAYDRFRSKEPLVKLESKKFDEEEYTKITTPRQDVLFKKGYFGRRRESSMEETVPLSEEMDGEEPIMDQIIITNGFVDERGHYLVNGNSYEIYDPYSNTVTVVVGPPPYANGVTQPVLAAVSCQPVPLQPVDWYPPGADWPSQGSAWVPSYSRNIHSDSVSAPDGTSEFLTSDAQISAPYNEQAYVVPDYALGESPLLNGVPLQTTEPLNSEEENRLELKKARKKSNGSVKIEEKEEETKPKQATKDEVTLEPIKKDLIIAQGVMEVGALSSPSFQFQQNRKNWTRQEIRMQTETTLTERKQVEKQSHSTQTYLLETLPESMLKLPGKESHSTQTPPEEFFQSNEPDLKIQDNSNKSLTDIVLSSPTKTEEETNPSWKLQGNSYGNSIRKLREEPLRRIFQQRTNFSEERKVGSDKSDFSPIKVSYAKKAMSGLENLNPKIVNGTSGKVLNGGIKKQSPMLNGTPQVLTTNGASGANNTKQALNYEDKRNGFVKTRYNRGKPTNDQMSQNFVEKKFEVKPFEEPMKKCEEIGNEFQSHSEKSSTVSELSSPTELSSGQNTPPEKLIVQKMEEEINKTFENKLKQNLSKAEEKAEEEEEEEEDNKRKEKKSDEKPKGKKKKNKGKSDMEKPKEPGKGNKKKKKRAEKEVKGKSESDISGEDNTFLSGIRQRDLLFGSWEGLTDDCQDFISEMDSLLNRNREILKSLGLNDDRTIYSKLPLHSDLLMMLPTFGWNRPKLKIEDFFVPASFHNDLFTKRNITNMKSTKPEEFFASVIDYPLVDKIEKKKESQKKMSKLEEISTPTKKTLKTNYKITKNTSRKTNQPVEEKKADCEAKDGKLGIVDAVNTWLQEQGDSDKFLSVENFENLTKEDERFEKEVVQKNGESNPIHALSPNASSASVADFRKNGGCIRVANVINDGFIHLSGEFPKEKKTSRIYRSSSWDAKLSEVNIKKHFKFLTDSASFCQDLISDVRNGLPTGIEYATEELCDPKQTVTKYYILTPNGRMRNESDSENEVFDALEYKFLTKENQEADGKSSNGNGNASITDSGVHSDVESSEDNASEQQKETTCKIQ